MIQSRQNTRLKDMRRLRKCKGDLALLEGPHLIGEALDAGLELRSILATPDFLSTPVGRKLAGRLAYPVTTVDPKLLSESADSDSPRGILASVHLPRGGTETLPVVFDGVYLYTEAVQDPGNLGALARVAEASGASGLALGPGTVHPNHPRALRASAGSLLRLKAAIVTSPEALDSHLNAIKPRWAALVPQGGSDLYIAPLEGCLVLALGAEGPGLSEEIQHRSELALTIPVEPPVESLNVTVAASLVLFEIRRRRRPEVLK